MVKTLMVGFRKYIENSGQSTYKLIYEYYESSHESSLINNFTKAQIVRKNLAM